MKVKRKSNRSLRNNVERTRLHLEQQLLESQLDALNFVDPRDAFRDENGVEWDEIGSGWGGVDEQVEPFRNESELTRIRRRCRRTVQRNPYAENFLINLVSFIAGKGHAYKVTKPKKGNRQKPEKEEKKPGEEKTVTHVESLQQFLDELLKINKWKHRQKEIVRRLHRDGECFLRVFPQEDGFSHFRFVEPGEVQTPAEYHHEKNCSFGIRTDEDDVETVESYFVNEEEVPAEEIQHRKINVDMNVKRGLSSIWCILANLDRVQNLLRNMSMVVTIQASIAMIRKHDTSTSAVRSFVNSNASDTLYNRYGETKRFKKYGPASVIDAKKGTEYEFPSIGLNPGAPVEVLGAELRAVASCKAMPEYMVGSDASNANYSSTMVAESPAVRFFEGEQENMIEADLELIQMAIDHAIETGRLSPEVKKLHIIATPPNLVTRDPYAVAQTDEIYMNARVKSPQTVQGELGYDSEEEMENWQEFDDRMMLMNPQLIDPSMEEDEDGGKGTGTKPKPKKAGGTSSKNVSPSTAKKTALRKAA